MKPYLRTYLLTALSSALVCLSAYAEPSETAPNHVNAVAAVQPQMKLTSVSTALTEGDVVGSVQSGEQCASAEPREWSELLRNRVEVDLPLVFQDELNKAQGASWPGNMEVQAFVNNLQISVCNLGQGTWQGGFNVQVSWQVMQNNRIVYKATTSGVVEKTKNQKSPSGTASLREAFAVAIRGLLADQGFVAASRATLIHLNHGA
jgi:hypothetical protein